MGVSDVENAVNIIRVVQPPLFYISMRFIFPQDSLLDVITSLGADERKLVLTATSFGNKFSLLDTDRTLPGAATNGKIETITYQQVFQSLTQKKLRLYFYKLKVCQTLKHGNWTVERDEDLTAPYGFNGKMWMAFDDAMRLILIFRL